MLVPRLPASSVTCCFFLNPATSGIFTLSLHDALPILVALGWLAGVPLGAGESWVVLRSPRSEEHTSELQSLRHLVCRLLLEKKKQCYRAVCLLPAYKGRQ